MIASFLLVLLGACDGPKETDAGCGLPARAAATPIAGDANGDGVVDIADGQAIDGALFRRGTAVACDSAADAVGDGVVDAGDATGIWFHLFAGTSAISPLAETCAKPRHDAICGDGVALSVEGADMSGASGGTATGTATVQVTSGPLTVDAVSVSVKATGCRVTAASFDGTAGADLRDGGLRHGGFARTDLATDGVVAALVFDLAGDAALPPSGSAAGVLSLSLEADVGSACSSCTLSFTDGLVGGGEPVLNVVSAHGYAYVPKESGATIQVCPA